MTTGPLAGIGVLEMCQVVSGPLAGQLLAQLGAAVIKVEQPGHGDSTRFSGYYRNGIGSLFANVNRGKRSVQIDAGRPEGRELIWALAGRSDVATQNFRPGKAAKLGIGPDDLAAVNPSLIYCSIWGYGPDGPVAHHKVYDYVIQADIGLADTQRDANGRPSLVKNYVVDKCTSYAAVNAALFVRERDPQRRGQHLELSMLDAGLEFFWPEGMLEHTYLDVEGTTPVPANLDFYDTYPTLDGAVAVYPVVADFFTGLAEACRRPEWLSDPRFVHPVERRKHMVAFAAAVASALAGMTTAEAVDRLRAADIAVAEVRARAEVHTHPQVVWNGSLVERDDPAIGRVRVPRPAARFGATPGPGPGDVPALGGHTSEVLAELGLSDAEIGALFDSGVVAGQ
jgi:crotonobetainyl-CoA:carnitine CoA-transferase CaiB-like acyl-CoA transferase